MLSTILLLLSLLLFNNFHPSDCVDTSVGVIDKGASNCVIGPMLPYGSINPSPQSRKGTSDGYKPAEPIRGFGQLHVSGTGWPTYGNFLISPQTGLATGLLDHESAHRDSITKPYLFSTTLERYGIGVEVTPAHYSAIYRFTYPACDRASIVFDAVHSIPGDIFPKAKKTLLESSSEIDPESGTVRMMIRMKGGWPEEPYVLWCVARIGGVAFSECGSWDSEAGPEKGRLSIEAMPQDSLHIGSYACFPTTEGQQVLLKLAVSFVSFEQAQMLLDAEIPGWNFDASVRRARMVWDRTLSSVKVKGGSDEDRIIFYSALYRFFTFAHERSLDREGVKVNRRIARRAMMGLAPEKDAARRPIRPYWDDNYALWDTFRTVYPMLTLLDEDCWRANMKALTDRFETRGGVWDSFVAGTDRKADQGGNDVDCIIAEGYAKKIKGIDWERAYAIIKHNADNMRLGHDQEGDEGAHLRYKELGWIPTCLMSSSQTLEFAYNDWCASQIAAGLGHDKDASKYFERSKGWINLWNPDLESGGYKGFIDARNADGSFAFIPPEKWNGSWVSPFYEGKTWTYSYYVPHDIPKLIELMGGEEEFVERLNYGYEHRLTEYDNEPGFLTLRAFTEAGHPEYSSFWAHHLMNNKFTLKGYPDNEDTGSMGSWYVFCALGLFPNAGQDFYYLNAPKFESATISLPRGRKLKIKANASKENVTIKSVRLRGKPVEGFKLTHEELLRGGTLEMELAPMESKDEI